MTILPILYELHPDVRKSFNDYIQKYGRQKFLEFITSGDPKLISVLEIMNAFFPNNSSVVEVAVKIIFPEVFFNRDHHESK